MRQLLLPNILIFPSLDNTTLHVHAFEQFSIKGTSMLYLCKSIQLKDLFFKTREGHHQI